MTRNDEIQIRRKTGNIFKAEEVPSVYALIKCYMHFQNDEYGRDLTIRKAIDEYASVVFRPLRDEILKSGFGTVDFYPEFMKRAFRLTERDQKAFNSFRRTIA